MKVLKFGGTSVGSTAAIKAIAKIIIKELNPIVVCSAMSGVTNLLLKISSNAAMALSYNKDWEELVNLHNKTIDELLANKQAQELKNIFNDKINELQQLVEGVSKVGEISDKTQAKVVAYGEQLSCLIVTAYLQSKEVKVQYTDARKLIITNSNYNNAQVNEELTNSNIKAWYSKQTNIVTGFISSDVFGNTTNLGRGGSDYTASILGAALQVDAIEIWTDVDGFYTADPRWVRNAYSLNQLSYNEAMELSYFGAKVIYAPTMIPAIKKQIPILIKNTFNPNHQGTLIQDNKLNNGQIVKGISSIADISTINIEGNGMVGVKGFSAKLFNALSQAQVNIILITQASSEHSITIGIAPEDEAQALSAIQEAFKYEITSKIIEPPALQKHLSILAVVGSNMKNAKGISGKLFSALGRNGINIIAIAQGSSELNISVVIEKSNLNRALNVVHDGLMLAHVKTVHLFICGIGQVGKELLQQIQTTNQRIFKNQHLHIKVMAIANSKQWLCNLEEGINLIDWENQFQEKAETFSLANITNLIKNVELPNSIFIDNTASTAVANIYEEILEGNCHIVTCNKIANSGTLERYNNLKKLAQQKGLNFYYETNVGAGLPIINTLNDLVISGDEIIKIEAILSGTISFIFNNYKGDISFTQIVQQAQALGYTEPDPRDDLNGLDFCRKVLILAREIGINLEMKDIEIQKILPDKCFEAKDVLAFYEILPKHIEQLEQLKKEAESAQKVLRYIATIEQNKAVIALKLVNTTHPFYSLSGSDNIISFTTGRYKNNPLVVKGPGAGVGVTAAGVFADIIKVTKQ